jgi:DNA invertase Pin-like site-specific DNA recombinase
MTRAAGSNSFSRDQPAGKLVFGIFAALTEFERDLIVAWSVMWRKSLSAIWRKGKPFRSNLSDYETVSRRRDDLLRDSVKVVDLQYSLDLSQKTGQ